MIIDDEMQEAAKETYAAAMDMIKENPTDEAIRVCLLSIFATGAMWGTSREKAKQVIECLKRT